MKEKFKNICIALLILLGFFLSNIILNAFFWPLTASFSVATQHFFSNIIKLVLCIILFFLFQKELKQNFKSITKINIKKYLIIYIIAMLCVEIINYFIFKLTNTLSTNDAVAKAFILSFPLNGIISSVILAPFYEELLFRLNFKNCFDKKWIFIIITGILFGGIHLLAASNTVELLYGISYVILGTALSYIYYDSKNIFASIGFHSFNNIIQIIIIFIGGYL